MRTSSDTPAAIGTLRRRLLVNTLVDPDEAATYLPPGVRPHLTPGGTVVGCCLLDLAQVRPAPLPRSLGIALRAAAHRISAEWESEEGELVVGVYVPERLTDSRLGVALGGRWFPGVHRGAVIALDQRGDGMRWSVTGRDLAVDVTARDPRRASTDLTCDPIAGACVGASVAISPNHHGVLEAARMELSNSVAREVEVDALRSTFIDGFGSATSAPAYLMEDINVAWMRDVAPRSGSRASVAA